MTFRGLRAGTVTVRAEGLTLTTAAGAAPVPVAGTARVTVTQ
jgi:hypothetical protein